MSNKLINLFWENYRVEKSLLRFFINVDERLRINKYNEEKNPEIKIWKSKFPYGGE